MLFTLERRYTPCMYTYAVQCLISLPNLKYTRFTLYCRNATFKFVIKTLNNVLLSLHFMDTMSPSWNFNHNMSMVYNCFVFTLYIWEGAPPANVGRCIHDHVRDFLMGASSDHGNCYGGYHSYLGSFLVIFGVCETFRVLWGVVGLWDVKIGENHPKNSKKNLHSRAMGR